MCSGPCPATDPLDSSRRGLPPVVPSEYSRVRIHGLRRFRYGGLVQSTSLIGMAEVRQPQPQKKSPRSKSPLFIESWTERSFPVRLQAPEQAALTWWWRDVAHGARRGAAIQFWAKAS